MIHSEVVVLTAVVVEDVMADTVTKHDVDDAAISMYVASVDLDDNAGSSDRDEFWNRFEQARDTYRRLKKSYDAQQ